MEYGTRVSFFYMFFLAWHSQHLMKFRVGCALQIEVTKICTSTFYKVTYLMLCEVLGFSCVRLLNMGQVPNVCRDYLGNEKYVVQNHVLR